MLAAGAGIYFVDTNVPLAQSHNRPGGEAAPARASDFWVIASCRDLIAAFELVRSEHETHTTPWGKAQPFTYAVLRRVTG